MKQSSRPLVAGKSIANGVTGELCHAVNIQLAHQVSAMDIDGSRRDMQMLRNLNRGMPFGDQLQYLSLAWAKVNGRRSVHVVALLDQRLRKICGNVATNISPSLLN